MPEIVIGDQHIYYEITGEGSHTVLLLPGILGTIDLDFGDVIPLLNKTDFRWVCWDPPGYGKSRPQDRQVDDEMFDRCVNYAAQLMENLGFMSYSVAGWSQGALFGMLLTSSYPDRIKKLVIWGAFISDSESFDMIYKGISKLDQWPKVKLDKILQYFERDYIIKHMNDTIEYTKVCRKKGVKSFKDRLQYIKCPTLILHGKRDIFVQLWQPLTIRQSIKNSKLCYFPDAGHGLHLDCTTKFIQVIEEFLRV